MVRTTLAVLALGVTLMACQPVEPELTEEQRLALLDTLMGIQRDLVTAAEATEADAVIAFFDSSASLIMGTEFVPYTSLVERLRRAYAAIDGQVVNWHPAKVSVMSRDIVAMTLAGSVATIVADDTSQAVPVAWSELWVRLDSGWKLLHAHQSMGSASPQ